jgi:hypothetical protein
MHERILAKGVRDEYLLPAWRFPLMFFLRPVGPSGLNPSVAMQAVAPSSGQFVIYAPIMWQGQPSAESWTAIYRLAYEQLVIAFGPSRFQRALEPSLN